MATPTLLTKNSGLGVLSLLFGLLSLALLCVLGGALYAANKITFDHDLKNGLASWLALQFFFFGPLLHLAGLCTGIVALFLRRQKKLAAVFGVLLNLALPAIGIVLTLFWALLSAIPPVR